MAVQKVVQQEPTDKTTNHIFYTFRIFCHKQRMQTFFTNDHLEAQCMSCPYFVGTAQGEGIECLYEDGLDYPIDIIRQNTQVDGLEKLMRKIYDAEPREDDSEE